MEIKRTIGWKGEVVIPKDIREYLGMKPGSKVGFEVRDKELVIKVVEDPAKFVEEFVKVPKKLKKRVNIKKLLEEQIKEEYDIR